MLQSIRRLAYSLSYCDIEEIMKEQGFEVDYSTIQRWVVHYTPQLEKAFHQKKKRPGDRWRLDETYIKIKGQWKYFYRAVDKQGAAYVVSNALKFSDKNWVKNNPYPRAGRTINGIEQRAARRCGFSPQRR